jgi:hypothetical protein
MDPWRFTNDDPSLKSKDGKQLIEYQGLDQLLPGLPLKGIAFLVQENKKYFISYNCGGPVTWSDDSSLIALPKWVVTATGNQQRLIIIDTKTLTAKVTSYIYNVIQIKKIDKDTVSFIEIGSPVIPEKKHEESIARMAYEEEFKLISI